jgi:hypothetical protein
LIPRSILRAALIAAAALLLLAPAVLADTCCANIPVGLDPASAKPADTVRLIGMQCLRSDGTGPLALNIGSFWLATTERSAIEPGDVPGPGLPQELPPVDEWLAFDSVPDPSAASGDATIKVPTLPNGTYQLWWWCDDGSGPGGGIHYSTGPRLTIGGSPDTDTAVVVSSGTSGSPVWPVGLGLALGAVVFVWTARWGPFRSSHAPTSRGAGSQSDSR